MDISPTKLRITVDDGKVVLYFDRTTDVYLLRWGDVKQMIRALDDCVNHLVLAPVTPASTFEADQIQTVQDRYGLAIRFPWDYKLVLSSTAAQQVSERLKDAIRKAQGQDRELVKELCKRR